MAAQVASPISLHFKEEKSGNSFSSYAYFCHDNHDGFTSMNLSACCSDVSVSPLASEGEVPLTKCECLY